MNSIKSRFWVPVEASEESPKAKQRFPGWRSLAAILGGFLVHLTLGNFFTLGNLSPYVISYLRHRVDPTVTISQAIWINAFSYTGQGSIMVLGGLLERRIGTRFTCIIGSIIFCGSIAFTSLAIQKGFIVFAFVYGLCTCLGLSFSYVAVLALGMRWFPHRKGLVNGIILAGYGLGALIFNPVQTALVNPNNIRVNSTDGYFSDENVLDRIPVMFLYMALIYAAIQVFSIVILFPVPDGKKQIQVFLVNVSSPNDITGTHEDRKDHNDLEEKKSPEPVEELNISKTPKEINTKEMFKYKEFYMLWFTFALHAQSIQFVNTYYKSYGETFIHNDHFLSTVGSVAAIFNCLGRIFWGQLQDKSSYKLCMLILSGCFTALMSTFCLVSYGGRPMFTIWVLVTFFTFSGIFSLMPTATSQAFGQKNTGTNFGVVFTAPAIMSVVGAPCIQFLLGNVYWTGTFLTLAGLNLIAFIITWFVPWKMETVRMES